MTNKLEERLKEALVKRGNLKDAIYLDGVLAVIGTRADAVIKKARGE